MNTEFKFFYLTDVQAHIEGSMYLYKFFKERRLRDQKRLLHSGMNILFPTIQFFLRFYLYILSKKGCLIGMSILLVVVEIFRAKYFYHSKQTLFRLIIHKNDTVGSPNPIPTKAARQLVTRCTTPLQY